MATKKAIGFVLLALLLLAAAVASVIYLVDRTREESWRQAFQLHLEGLSERGLATTFDELNARLPDVAEGENGAELLIGIVEECDAVCGGSEDYDGPLWTAMKAIDFGETPSEEHRSAAESLLRDESERLEALWTAVDAAVARPTVQAPFHFWDPDGPPTLQAGHRRAWFLMLLRAWARPDQELRSARTLLRLVEHETRPPSCSWMDWDEPLDSGLTMLRRVIGRGEQIPSDELVGLDRQLATIEGRLLANYLLEPQFFRVYWAHYADPDHERWPWISDYDHFGEGWKLYRDFLRAFDRVDAVAANMKTEADVRAFATEIESKRPGEQNKLADWNSQLPPLGTVGAWTLEALTKIRLARHALAITGLRGDAAVSAAELRERATKRVQTGAVDALTGEPFIVAEEDGNLFVGVPWRLREFPLRPAFTSVWTEDWDEPKPTWATDDLRDDGYIWKIAQ